MGYAQKETILEKRMLAKHQYMHHGGIAWRVSFVASINPGYDWACYVCASTEHFETAGMAEEAAVEICCERGNKLLEEIARALFPSVQEIYRE